MNSSKHEMRCCPRCGREFCCMSNRVEHCECMQVPISEALADRISEYFDECLCVHCLRELQQAAARGEPFRAFPDA